MTTLRDAVALAAPDNGLAVISTVRADATVQASLVNVGLMAHPATGEPALGFTTYGKVKLANLRARPPWHNQNPAPARDTGRKPASSSPVWPP